MLILAALVLGPLGWAILLRGLATVPNVQTAVGFIFAWGATASGAILLAACAGALAWALVRLLRR